MLRRTGPRSEKETIIRFCEGDPIADIGTASHGFMLHLLKKGFAPLTLDSRWATFRVPKKLVGVRKPRRQASAS